MAEMHLLHHLGHQRQALHQGTARHFHGPDQEKCYTGDRQRREPEAEQTMPAPMQCGIGKDAGRHEPQAGNQKAHAGEQRPEVERVQGDVEVMDIHQAVYWTVKV